VSTSIEASSPVGADRVRQLLSRTEYLAAFDAAEHALADEPDQPELQHLAILALARAGATDTADVRLQRSGLIERADSLDVALAEDVLALEARIAKDRALAASLDDRPALAAVAATRYEAVFDRHRRTYTGVNAATMWCVAGDLERSHRLAQDVLALLGDDDSYWTHATRGEALLLLGRPVDARAALAHTHAAGDDIAARASTRRQLALICDVLDIDPSVLDALSVPVVLHYCGHLPSTSGPERLHGADERRVAREVNALIARCGSVIAHGSLAAGADVIVAEAILASGGELHVVLPFPAAEFETTSVIGAGEDWLERHRRCLARATSVTVVTGGRQGDDDAAYEYCSSIAMGGALVRAQLMASRAEQLAVWDGQTTDRSAGTAADIQRWRATGRPATVVPVAPPPVRNAPAPAVGHARAVRALLFADVKGFSSLLDHQIPSFVEGILGPLSAVLDRAQVPYRNGWGDALYVVFDDVRTAADVALALQETMAAVDLAALGLPTTMGLRIGMHAGPVFVMHDPVRDEPSFFGEHVTRAARIEPVAPPGAVFVTDGLAALLALEQHDQFVCEYVGRVPSAKSFGPLPMHLLRRQRTQTDA
jgi:adenylate cyclase